MADLIGEISYPGLRGFQDASGTISQGITPGRITVSVGPNFGQIAPIGPLAFTDGTRTVTLRDCRVVDFHATATIQTRGGQLVFEDRRWKWQYPTISGRYNVPVERANVVPLVPVPGQGAGGNANQSPPVDPRGTDPIDPRTKITARNMAILCLQAMGEQRYDVSALPANAYPTAEWDVTNAAQALQELVESLGCRVVYQPVANRVLIAKQGVGAQLPDGPPMVADSPGLEVKPRPGVIRVVYGRNRYQIRFALGAVLKDFDDSWRWIDDVSYKPSGGWTIAAHSPRFAGHYSASQFGRRTQYDAAALAQDLYLTFRIKPTSPLGGPLRIPPLEFSTKGGVRTLQSFNARQSAERASKKRPDQVRLLPFLNATTRDDLGNVQQVAAKVYGKHHVWERVKLGDSWVTAYSETTNSTEVTIPFTIDAEHQIIKFAKQAFALDSSGKWVEPSLVLECACEVIDNDTHQYLRAFCDMIVPGGSPDCVLHFVKEDLVYEYTAHYRSGTNQFSHHTSNAELTKPKADFYLRGEAQRYLVDDEASDRTLAGIYPIDPDGAIQQVTWTVGSTVSTRASRNTEHNLYIPSYEGRRRLEETSLRSWQRRQEQFRQDMAENIGMGFH